VGVGARLSPRCPRAIDLLDKKSDCIWQYLVQNIPERVKERHDGLVLKSISPESGCTTRKSFSEKQKKKVTELVVEEFSTLTHINIFTSRVQIPQRPQLLLVLGVEEEDELSIIRRYISNSKPEYWGMKDSCVITNFHVEQRVRFGADDEYVIWIS